MPGKGYKKENPKWKSATKKNNAEKGETIHLVKYDAENFAAPH